jgi:hypothetical protein
MKPAVSISALLILAATVISAQAPVTTGLRFQLVNESAITIKGSSTVNTFTCTSQYIQGSGTATSISAKLDNPDVSAEIAAQVKLFDCGNGRMNRDLWNALKSDDNPLITYSLDDALVGQLKTEDGEAVSIVASGHLAIAGVEQPIELALTAKLLGDGDYAITGQQDIKMSDFDVERPTALLGLVKAHDDITIYFDLRSTATLFQSTQE